MAAEHLSVDSGLVDERGEELVIGPRRLGRARGVVLSAALIVVLVVVLIVRLAEPTPCDEGKRERPSAGSTISSRPWVGADSPLVRDLHFRVLDLKRTAADDPPSGAMPVDVRTSAREVGKVAGITIYLAGGSGFACLGASGLGAHDAAAPDATSVCLLNTSIANQGLTMSVTPEDNDDSLLVVAVPDGFQLLMEPSTVQVAVYPSVAVLRPGPDPLYLQAPGQARVPLPTAASNTVATSSC